MPFEPAPKTDEQQRIDMGKIALEAIAAHILTVPACKVDMGGWCGTAKCAIGHGIRLPEVVATGLYLARSPKTRRMIPAFNGRAEHHESIAAAFGIPALASWRLFGNRDVDTAQAVASAIRAYLSSGVLPNDPDC